MGQLNPLLDYITQLYIYQAFIDFSTLCKLTWVLSLIVSKCKELFTHDTKKGQIIESALYILHELLIISVQSSFF
jgi:hypothetical protein